jgi:hypothetical protein
VGHHLVLYQMKKIARRQSEDTQGADKAKKNGSGKNNQKNRKGDDTSGRNFIVFVTFRVSFFRSFKDDTLENIN